MGSRKLRIVHCVRAPIGGIFRHVADLATAQAKAGHAVGVICDASTGGAFEDAHIARLAPSLALGFTRIPMRRAVSPADLLSLAGVLGRVAKMRPDVLHAHGAKGGAYARLIGTALRTTGRTVARLYSPHGGSLHYDPASREGRVYFRLERLLERFTDMLVFVSDYERRAYEAKVGTPRVPSVLVYNGLAPHEWMPVETLPDARDFLFIGMLRDLKGPDIFIEALARLRRRTGQGTAHIVGTGDDAPRYREMARQLGLDGAISFHEPMPARTAFGMARIVVVPSRAESMPYIVLETIAAGRPLIATRVGGIPEIFGDKAGLLVPPGDADALAAAMAAALADPAARDRQAAALRSAVRPLFSIEAMSGAIEAAYEHALAHPEGEASPFFPWPIRRRRLS